MQSLIQRGEVYRANFNPQRGSEQAGIRPAIVVSRDAINKSSPVVVVVPCTDASNKSKVYPSHVRFAKGTAGFTMDTIAACEQIRAISTERLMERMGVLSRPHLTQIEAAIKITLDLP